MYKNRRKFVMAFVSIASLGGCSDVVPSNENTTIADFDVTDIEIVNDRTERIEVTTMAMTNGETTFEETVALDREKNYMFDNPLQDNTRYTLRFTVNDTLTKEYDWSPKTRDDSGVRVLIERDDIEFEPIIA